MSLYNGRYQTNKQSISLTDELVRGPLLHGIR